MTGVSDVAQSEAMRQRIADIQAQLDTKSRQLSSGKKAEVFSDLGADAGRVLDLRSELAKLSEQDTGGDRAASEMEAMQSSLERIAEVTQSLSQDTTSDLPEEIRPVVETAESRVTQMVNFLNTKMGDKFLFSGQASGEKPVADQETLLRGNSESMGFYDVVNERIAADNPRNGDNPRGTGWIETVQTSQTDPETQDRQAGDRTVAIQDSNPGLGFSLTGIGGDIAGAHISEPVTHPDERPNAPPLPEDSIKSQRITFENQPEAGETVRIGLRLPDGREKTVSLTAVDGSDNQPQQGEFARGADAEEAARNFEASLQRELGRVAAGPQFRSASVQAAADDFFDYQPPAVVTDKEGNQSEAIYIDSQVRPGDRYELALDDRTVSYVAEDGDTNQDVRQELRDKVNDLGGSFAAGTVELSQESEANPNITGEVTQAATPTDAKEVEFDVDDLNGPVEEGNVFRVEIAGTEVSYEAAAGDNTNDVAAGLRSEISSVVTNINGAGSGSIVRAEHTSVNVDFGFGDIRADNRQEEWQAELAAGDVVEGAEYALDIGGQTYSYVAQAGDDEDAVMAGLAEALPDVIQDGRAGTPIEVGYPGGGGDNTIDFAALNDDTDFNLDSPLTVRSTTKGETFRLDARADGVDTLDAELKQEPSPEDRQIVEYQFGGYLNDGDDFNLRLEDPNGNELVVEVQIDQTNGELSINTEDGGGTTVYDPADKDVGDRVTVEDLRNGVREALVESAPGGAGVGAPQIEDLDFPVEGKDTLRIAASNLNESFEFTDITINGAPQDFSGNLEPDAHRANRRRAMSSITLSEGQAPQRVFDDPADPKAVNWYQGSDDAESPRASRTAQITDGETLDYGIRANEPALRDALKTTAALAAQDFDDAQRPQVTSVDFDGPPVQGPLNKLFTVEVGDSTVTYEAEPGETMQTVREALVDRLRDEPGVADQVDIAPGKGEGEIVLSGNPGESFEASARSNIIGPSENPAPDLNTIQTPGENRPKIDEVTIPDVDVDAGDAFEVTVRGPNEDQTFVQEASYLPSAERSQDAGEVADSLAGRIAAHPDVTTSVSGRTIEIEANTNGEEGKFRTEVDARNVELPNRDVTSTVETLAKPGDGEAAIEDLVVESNRRYRDAVEGIDRIKGDLGISQKQADEQLNFNQDVRKQLEDQLSELEDVDNERVASELLTVQNRLQMSYQITQRIQELNLANYL